MKIYFLLAIFLFSIDIAFTQTINVKFLNSEDERASLSLLEGEKVLLIDSINSINKGKFQFTLEKRHPGLYRLSLSNNKWIIFIYDNEEVYLETDADIIEEFFNRVRTNVEDKFDALYNKGSAFLG